MLSFNEYEEKKVQLQEGLKAEDYEAAIVIGWHKNNRKKIKSPEEVGINPGVYKTLLKSPEALKAGELIAKAIAKRFGNKNAKAEQYGRAKSSLTSFWKSYGLNFKNSIRHSSLLRSLVISFISINSGCISGIFL